MKLFLRIGAVCYTFFLFYIFFLARHRPRPTLFRHQEPVNIVPLKNKLAEIAAFGSMTNWEKTNLIADLFGNIALFIPLPFALAFILNIKTPWKVLLIAFALSAGVEFIQFATSVGVADVDDIIFNTLGALIGLVLLKALKKILPGVYNAFNGQFQHLP